MAAGIIIPLLILAALAFFAHRKYKVAKRSGAARRTAITLSVLELAHPNWHGMGPPGSQSAKDDESKKISRKAGAEGKGKSKVETNTKAGAECGKGRSSSGTTWSGVVDAVYGWVGGKGERQTEAVEDIELKAGSSAYPRPMRRYPMPSPAPQRNDSVVEDSGEYLRGHHWREQARSGRRDSRRDGVCGTPMPMYPDPARTQDSRLYTSHSVLARGDGFAVYPPAAPGQPIPPAALRYSAAGVARKPVAMHGDSPYAQHNEPDFHGARSYWPVDSTGGRRIDMSPPAPQSPVSTPETLRSFRRDYGNAGDGTSMYAVTSSDTLHDGFEQQSIFGTPTPRPPTAAGRQRSPVSSLSSYAETVPTTAPPSTVGPPPPVVPETKPRFGTSALDPMFAPRAYACEMTTYAPGGYGGTECC